MKYALRSALFLFLAAAPFVFAGGGLEEPPGEPPHGVAVQSDAPGTKLNGVLFIEFYDIQANFSASGRFILRLRKGKDFEVFYGEAFVTDFTSPSIVQTAVTNVLKQVVLDRFFNGADLTVKVKALEEFGELTTPTSISTTLSTFILADVVLAVQ